MPRKLLCGTRDVRRVDVRLPGKGNSNSHGARPVHLIIAMIKWIRTSRLSIKNTLSQQPPQLPTKPLWTAPQNPGCLRKSKSNRKSKTSALQGRSKRPADAGPAPSGAGAPAGGYGSPKKAGVSRNLKGRRGLDGIAQQDQLSLASFRDRKDSFPATRQQRLTRRRGLHLSCS